MVHLLIINHMKKIKKFKTIKQHGYFIVAPHVSIKVLGKEVSGTRIRELLGSPER